MLRHASLLAALPLAGCALLVGDPHGDRVFVDAAAGEAGAPDMGAPEVDGTTGGPDTSPGSDAFSVGDSSMADVGCPGTAGPSSVRIAQEAGPSYCIDSTEVTNADYAIFLGSGFSLAASATPAMCVSDAGPLSLTPSAGWPSAFPSLPVHNVSWCQAYAYCAWAGKRLCGEIGGGSLPRTDFANAALSQWFNACSAGGALAYPYGNTFDLTICGGERTLPLQNAGTPAQCVGGYPGLYNMSGNLWEWTDCCPSSSSCYAMGGAYDGTQADNACNGTRNWVATDGAGNIGIRCCSDP
jgi:hypothetical protein